MAATTLHSPSAGDDGLALAVIVPCHNVAPTLPQQLDALVSERWTKPWGIIVVDNNSTDATRDVALRYAGRGVRLVSANSGRGVAYARNAGARETTAAAVAFCDGDDVIAPGWVSAIGNGLEEADIVSGRVETELLNEGWLAETRPMGRPGALPTFGKIGFASGGNCGIRRDTFERLNGYDETFIGLEDIEFSLRARAAGARIRAVPEAILHYRLRAGLASVWRQGFFYGRGRPHLILRARELGLASPGRLEGLRSWAWVLCNIGMLRQRAGRYKLLWVVANRLGVIRGAISQRQLFI